jgi:hypothetical protein
MMLVLQTAKGTVEDVDAMVSGTHWLDDDDEVDQIVMKLASEKVKDAVEVSD